MHTSRNTQTIASSLGKDIRNLIPNDSLVGRHMLEKQLGPTVRPLNLLANPISKRGVRNGTGNPSRDA